MKNTIKAYIMEQEAKAEAAKILAEAIERAEAVLKKAGVEEPCDELTVVWDAYWE